MVQSIRNRVVTAEKTSIMLRKIKNKALSIITFRAPAVGSNDGILRVVAVLRS